jgi:hypothetical protein
VRKEVPVKLFAFDLLWLDGADLTGSPLEEHRRLLEQTVTEGKAIGLTYFIDVDGRRLFEESRRLGLEGVVAKRLGSPYLPGRSPDWRKIKASATPLLVVDAPSLLYRAFFALPRTITGPDGQAVNALLGTATSSWPPSRPTPLGPSWSASGPRPPGIGWSSIPPTTPTGPRCQPSCSPSGPTRQRSSGPSAGK